MAEDLATRLVNAVEKLYIENRLLRAILDHHKVPGWQELLEETLAHPNPESLAKMQAQFEPVRARIRDQQNLEQVLQEFLQVVPPKKDVN